MTKPEQKQGKQHRVIKPSGIRWVAVYTVLIITGYGQYGLAFLLKGSEIFLGVALTLLTLSFTVATYGLLKRKLWGYKLTVTLYTVLICFEVLRFTIAGMGSSASVTDILIQVQAMGFAAWILHYLKKEKVKLWFNKEEQGLKDVLSAKEMMEEEAVSVRKRGEIVILSCVFAALIPVTVWLSGKLASIPELNDMRITEAELIDVKRGTRRGGLPYLVLKEDNGLVSSIKVTKSERYEPFVGQRVKVWSTDYCSLFGTMCFESAYQVKYLNEHTSYRNKMILDYKMIRKNNEKVKYKVSTYDFIFWGLALFFILLGVVVFYDTKRKVKIIQDRFNDKEVEE